jgi:hypothetical protein
MKYYIASISEEYMDLEFNTAVLVMATDKTIDEKLRYICSTWYSEDHPVHEGVAEDGVYEQPNGCITYAGGVKEITEETFNELKQFLGAL